MRNCGPRRPAHLDPPARCVNNQNSERHVQHCITVSVPLADLSTNVLSSAVDLKLQNRCQVWCMDIIEHQHDNPKLHPSSLHLWLTHPNTVSAISSTSDHAYTAAWPHGCSLPHEAHGCRASPKHARRVVVMLHVWVDWDKLRLQTFLNANNATHVLMYGKQ